MTDANEMTTLLSIVKLGIFAFFHVFSYSSDGFALSLCMFSALRFATRCIRSAFGAVHTAARLDNAVRLPQSTILVFD